MEKKDRFPFKSTVVKGFVFGLIMIALYVVTLWIPIPFTDDLDPIGIYRLVIRVFSIGFIARVVEEGVYRSVRETILREEPPIKIPAS